MKSMIGGLAVLAFAAAASAGVNYNGGVYSQNFDTLPTSGTFVSSGSGPFDINTAFGVTGVDGWSGGNFAGSSGGTEFRAQDGSLGSSSGRGIESYGSEGSTDRALGLLATSNQISTIGAVFMNNTGQNINEVTISFTGEQWRRGDVSSPDTLGFAYGMGTSITNATTVFSALDFTGVNTQGSPTQVALDGNAAGNRAAISATITGLSWAPGTSLAISWTSTELSGQDDGLGIDNFQLSTRVVPAPGAAVLLGVAGVAAGRRRR